MAELRQPRPLVLASTSPRRSELLREAGYEFTIAEPPMQEPQEPRPHVTASNYAESLAYFKARSVVPKHPSSIIMAADTLVVLDREMIGKPSDVEDARRILRRISGTTHSVITGVVVLRASKDQRDMRHAVTLVRVRPLSEATIDSYLKTGQWEGKAGAYGIQDREDPFVETLEGSRTNVVGLPMELVRQMFAEWK